MPLTTWDVHFFPQALNCSGLFQAYRSYDFVGSMGEHFYQDLGCFSNEYPLLKLSLQKVFQVNGKENVTNNQGVETKAASQMLDFYTSHTVRHVLEYTAIDYVMLGLPIPRWAEEMLANGTFSNSNKSGRLVDTLAS
jgi:hypothetical protein